MKAEAKKVYESGLKNTQAQTPQKPQNWDKDESDFDSEHEILRITRNPAVGTRDELEAGPSHRNMSSPKLTTMGTQIGTKSSDGEHSNTERAEAVDVGKASSVPSVSDDVVASKNWKEKAERAKKQRLVSYLSQELQGSDGAGSRYSSRKRMAVTKFSGVMIDSIFKRRRNKGEGEKERDTN